MLWSVVVCLCILMGAMVACKEKRRPAPAAIPTVAADSASKLQHERSSTAGNVDTPHHRTTGHLRRILSRVFEQDLSRMSAEDRQFTYHQIDLNGDRKQETFIGFYGPFHCAKGGCTALLLDHTGRVLTRFTVTEYPILVLPTATRGWRDLVVGTAAAKPAIRLVKWNGRRYPGNPVKQPEYVSAPALTIKEVFNFKDYEEQWYTF